MSAPTEHDRIELVSTERLERELTAVRGVAVDPLSGVFGPRSMTWLIDREAAIFLGAGRALLLQLAHPWVAAAVKQRSDTFANPIGRFHRTFSTVDRVQYTDRHRRSSRYGAPPSRRCRPVRLQGLDGSVTSAAVTRRVRASLRLGGAERGAAIHHLDAADISVLALAAALRRSLSRTDGTGALVCSVALSGQAPKPHSGAP